MPKFIFKEYKRATKSVNSFKDIKEILAIWDGGGLFTLFLWLIVVSAKYRKFCGYKKTVTQET